MNREIKFRAWDRIKEKMVIWDDFHHLDLFALSDPLFKIMQFTGLLDKNGKEIYEGDILRCTHFGLGEPETTSETVTFSDGIFWCGPLCLCEYTNSEIIGNIYENPELLEAK